MPGYDYNPVSPATNGDRNMLTVLAIIATGTEPVPGIGDEGLDATVRDLLDMYWEEPTTRGFLVLDDELVVATLVTVFVTDSSCGTVAVTRYDGAPAVAATTLYAVAYRHDERGMYAGTAVEELTPVLPAAA